MVLLVQDRQKCSAVTSLLACSFNKLMGLNWIRLRCRCTIVQWSEPILIYRLVLKTLYYIHKSSTFLFWVHRALTAPRRFLVSVKLYTQPKYVEINQLMESAVGDYLIVRSNIRKNDMQPIVSSRGINIHNIYCSYSRTNNHIKNYCLAAFRRKCKSNVWCVYNQCVCYHVYVYFKRIKRLVHVLSLLSSLWQDARKRDYI